ncbi:anaerobic ribonucleoside-triphosphate reductase [Paenibacillus sp. DS2015]
MQEVQAACQQAAENLIHDLHTLSSRTGGQIPFTSMNYRTSTIS